MKKFKYPKRISSLLIAAALAVVSVGCGNGRETAANITEGNTEETTATVTAEQMNLDEDEVETKGITESGQSVERIVSGYYITTSMLIALGLKERIVGIEAKADKRPIYKLAAPELLQLPNVGTAKEFDLEGCVALEPDLVILPQKQAEQADILADLGINSLVVNPESMDELKKTIMSVAEATGASERADQLLTYFDEKTTWLASLAEEDKNQGARPSIYISGNADILRTAGKNMYQNEMIEMAGGINVAEDLTDAGWSNISYEKLLTYNPDYIIISSEADYTKEDVFENDLLKDLKAVQNKAVYEMPYAFEAWDSPVPSGILGSMWLGSIINEEAYPFETFKKDAAAFYNEFYGIEIDSSLITQ
ncbi:ABC transporter substrate-binding protein [[Clostridium] symbiosum]|uniref:ABC transporter substrate-binding protein n=1 Tax=Clostridium symbiosum TaxID=1512 RepID=UPI001D06FD9A|nr:ABC transporter substrate-binding protein [[Clostridium] symbiosum]MCB6610724.1 ABC transporter substrate-binding protein [[Clostridium] symbiosum]MCB6930272.1 ABC transporter substrate-binding protein [[Clostridium] symbiosum]